MTNDKEYLPVITLSAIILMGFLIFNVSGTPCDYWGATYEELEEAGCYEALYTENGELLAN